MASTVEDTARMLGRTHDIRFDRLMPGYHDRIVGNAKKQQERLISENFPVIVIKLCLFMVISATILFGAAKFYGSIIAKGGHSTNPTQRQIVIGDDVIAVPENMIRFRSQRNQHNLGQLDLYAQWPGMEGFNVENAAIFDSADPTAPLLFVTIEPRDMTRDMSGRLSSIYEKFFAGPPVDAGNGLVRRPFSNESAYFAEDLYYEVNSPYPFAARCIRENRNIADPFCIRDIHIGRDLMVTYRFHARFLPDWLAMDRAVRDRFTSMLVE